MRDFGTIVAMIAIIALILVIADSEARKQERIRADFKAQIEYCETHRSPDCE